MIESVGDFWRIAITHSVFFSIRLENNIDAIAKSLSFRHPERSSPGLCTILNPALRSMLSASQMTLPENILLYEICDSFEKGLARKELLLSRLE
jgi:hypothetical protein